MSFFYYLRKLTSFTHGWLLSLRLCSYFFSYLWVWVCVVVVVAVGLFMLLSNLFWLLFAWSVEGERLLWWRVFECIVFSHAKKGKEVIRAEEIGLGFPEKEQGCCIRERCPVGSLIVGAMMTRWLFGMCVDHCFWFSYGCQWVYFLFCGCCLGETGIFYQEEKVCLCVCFLCVFFFLLRVQ